MTLLPVTERTTYCFHDCGKDICSCKPASNDQLKKIWESGNHLDNGGLKVTDFLKNKNEMQKEEWVKLKIPNLLNELNRIRAIQLRSELLTKGIKRLKNKVRRNLK